MLIAGQAQANLEARFLEGAPKDRFVLTNTGDCALPAATITLDLSPAASGLVFDVTASGAGVQVFQPFDVVAGVEALNGLPVVLDGDTAISLDVKGLAPDQTISFTIDVDDTGGGREITVSNSEIAGALVTVTLGNSVAVGTFDEMSQAVVRLAVCLS
jgi:hypothetical protein